jgi:periplasmic divalent cation tolerance protein
LNTNHSHRPSPGHQPPGDPSLARVVLVTHPAEGAQEFAQAIVGARLAACVNLLPATSVYRWEGVVEAAEEVLLVIKTSSARMDDLRAHVLSAHPYDCPEFLGLTPGDLEGRYLTWLLAASSEEQE